MNQLTNAALAGVLGIGIAAPAIAGGNYDYARVTHVEPLTRTVEVSTPRQECWYETVTHHQERRGNDTAGLIVGGIVGGILGNQVGGGNGKKVATVAGTLLGAGVGQELAGRGHPREREWTSRERRCDTVHDRHYEERTIGYRVHYRYHGENYVTEMDRYPGDRIRVHLQVTPVE